LKTWSIGDIVLCRTDSLSVRKVYSFQHNENSAFGDTSQNLTGRLEVVIPS
jgi:hypothetical protein